MSYTRVGYLYLTGADRALETRRLAASYHAASRSPDAMRNYAGTDFLSADAALSHSVRRLISARARNEFVNNSFAYGIVTTLANDTIGRGPQLQYGIYDDEADAPDTALDARLQRRERRFSAWCRSVGLTALLRCARIAKAVDGEVFVRLSVNPGARREVPLEPALFEQEYVSSVLLGSGALEYWGSGQPKEVDGILYDRHGNATAYRFWRVHPGSSVGMSLSDSSEVPARTVLHYANRFRPGQHRGVSEMSAALPVFNDLRRYSTAVVLAAEIAARLSFIISNDLPPETLDAATPRDADGVPVSALEQDGGPITWQQEQFNSLVLPAGYRASQMHSEQPTATYASFRDTKINEAARVFSMPFNVAAGNSSSYNYASGRLDHQVYHKTLLIERDAIGDTILDPLLAAWEEFDAANHSDDYDISAEVSHTWMWDGFEHVDPVKEANAQAARLANGVTTLAEECAREGRDYLAVIAQRQRELDLYRRRGLPPPPWMNASAPTLAPDGGDQPANKE